MFRRNPPKNVLLIQTQKCLSQFPRIEPECSVNGRLAVYGQAMLLATLQGWPKELVMGCENFQNLCVVISGTIRGVGRLPFLPFSLFLQTCERVAGRPTHRFARSTLRRIRSGRRDSIPRSLGNVKSNEDFEAAKFTEESGLSLPKLRDGEWQPLFIIKD